MSRTDQTLKVTKPCPEPSRVPSPAGDVLWLVGEDDRNMHSGYYADLALQRWGEGPGKLQVGCRDRDGP